MNKTLTFPIKLDESISLVLEKLLLDSKQLPSSRIIIDLSAVRIFDFDGVRALLNFIGELSSSFKKIIMIVPQPKLASLLQFWQFDSLAEFQTTPKPINQIQKEN